MNQFVVDFIMLPGSFEIVGLIRKENRFSGEHDSGDRSVSYSDPRDDRLSRDIIACDEEEEAELLHWVPYVHFGV
jgi:hypothetical protein